MSRVTKLNKEDEGITLYALPNGNNAGYGKDKITTFKVVKVKRKYVELKHEGCRYTDNYDLETGVTQSEINQGYEFNSGYVFFKSLEDIEHYKEYKDKRTALHLKITAFHFLDRLEDTAIEKLYTLLKEEGIVE